jgi:hypothetical protein
MTYAVGKPATLLLDEVHFGKDWELEIKRQGVSGARLEPLGFSRARARTRARLFSYISSV